ncbi:MAG: ABC transporter ATP-binding protein [Candidatus Caldarchaeum sp.]
MKARNLTKGFNGFLVLDKLNFDIPEGSFTLLLGPNGAGKTTFLRCLLGLVRFDGELKVYGLDVKQHGKSVRRLIGYMPQSISLYNDLTITEVLDFFSDLRNVSITLDELGRFGLKEKAEVRVGELSGGMRQRLSLLLALMGNPPILAMDEPFSNLDARGRLELVNILKTLKQQGKTILLSTHTVSEVLTLADDILVLNRGKLIRTMKSYELPSAISLTYRIHLRAGGENLEALGLRAEASSAGWLTFETEDLYATLTALVKQNINIQGAIIEEPVVDELVMRLEEDAV